MGIIAVEKVEGDVVYAPPQGLLVREPVYDPGHWQALSDFTRVSHKDRPMGDPWGPEHKWRPARRDETWQVWRTWQSNGDIAPTRTAANTKTSTDKE